MSDQDDLNVVKDVERLILWAQEQNEILTKQLNHALLFSTPKIASQSSGPISFATLVSKNPLCGSFASYRTTESSEVLERKKLIDYLESFNSVMMKRNINFWSASLPSELVFFKLSLEALINSSWPSWFCLLACHGLMSLCYELICSSHPQEESSVKFKKWLAEQLKIKEALPPFINWQRSFAAYLFYWSQVFDGADAKNGLAMLPCFGLPDSEVLYYGQGVLRTLQKATMGWIKEEGNSLTEVKTTKILMGG